MRPHLRIVERNLLVINFIDLRVSSTCQKCPRWSVLESVDSSIFKCAAVSDNVLRQSLVLIAAHFLSDNPSRRVS